MDGNNSLKRVRHVGNYAIADQRVFNDSNYFLSHDYVNQFANEVKSRQNTSGDVTIPDAEQENDMILEGDPTDGGGEIPCADNWKAAAADDAKRMWGLFDETGIFAAACRHGLILWIADMIKSGELYVVISFFVVASNDKFILTEPNIH